MTRGHTIIMGRLGKKRKAENSPALAGFDIRLLAAGMDLEFRGDLFDFG
jgi:hypothetical protein